MYFILNLKTACGYGFCFKKNHEKVASCLDNNVSNTTMHVEILQYPKKKKKKYQSFVQHVHCVAVHVACAKQSSFYFRELINIVWTFVLQWEPCPLIASPVLDVQKGYNRTLIGVTYGVQLEVFNNCSLQM